jgi:hypothetical protein
MISWKLFRLLFHRFGPGLTADGPGTSPKQALALKHRPRQNASGYG